MKEQYVFMITHRGDRTNIMANFKVVDKEEFISYIKENTKQWQQQYRYAKIGGVALNLKEMNLAVYDELFKPDTFTPEQITELFRKEISEAYGQHKEWKKAKPLSNKDLVVGGVYKTQKGNLEVYLGKCKKTKTFENINHWDKKSPEITEGYGWFAYYSSNIENLKTGYDGENLLTGSEVLKSNRKVYEFTGHVYDLPKEASFASGGYWSGSKYACKIERL